MTQSVAPDDRASSEAHAWHALLRGQPSSSERAEFERWYSEDPANRQAYDRIDMDWTERYGLLAQTSAGHNRAGLARPDRPRFRGYAMAAAALAILLLAAVLLVRPGTEPAARAEIFATAIGEIRTVTLADDTRVTLDTGSRVAVRYGERERRVELQEGRARFDVRSLADQPFVVEAEGGEIVASATVFDVSLASGGATVALIEGDVEVRGPVSSARRRLRAGQRVLVHPQGRLEDVLPASQAELRWPSGMLEFLNTPLEQAVSEANRYSSRRIRIAEPATARLRVTGTFRAGDTLGLARSLAAAFSLRVEEVPGGEIVLRPPG